MLHVFRHELRLIFRDPKFWIPFVIPPVILAASQAIAISRYGVAAFEGMDGYMMLLLGCLMAPMGAPLAADSFAGERERNSLELLQLSPIAPALLFWGKLLAIMPFSIVFSLAVQLAYWASHPSLSRGEAFSACVGALSASLLVNSFTLVLSLRAKTVRSATQASLFLIVPLLLLVQFGYGIFFANPGIPFAILLGSVAVSVGVMAVSFRRFCTL